MNVFIEAVGFGVAVGAVIALGAVGFTVQFGISNVLNITYGAMMTLAAYLGYAFLQSGVGVWEALALASVLIAVASVLFNRVLLAPLGQAATHTPHPLQRTSLIRATIFSRSSSMAL